MKIILGFFLISSLTLICSAQSAESLKDRIQEHYKAIHSDNMEETTSHHLEEFSMFPWNGATFFEPGFFETANSMGANLNLGEPNVTMKHFSAQLYDKVGVATFYLEGSYGEETGTWRVTAVWVWKDGLWKEAHHHESRLIAKRSD